MKERERERERVRQVIAGNKWLLLGGLAILAQTVLAESSLCTGRATNTG